MNVTALWILLFLAATNANPATPPNAGQCAELIVVQWPSKSVTDAYRSCRRIGERVSDQQLDKEIEYITSLR